MIAKLEVSLPLLVTRELLHLAQLSPLDEVCGLVASQNNIACRCYPIANTSPTPATHFHINAHQQIAAFAQMRRNGEDLFGIYHSHPTSPAVPSATDIELAAYPDACYFIISLNTKGVLELCAYKIADSVAHPVTLHLLR